MFIESRQLQEATAFVKCITEGQNPTTGKPDSNGFITHPDTLRNMYFVLDILTMIKSGELISKHKSPFPYEILKEFRYMEDKGITNFIKQVYAPLSENNVQKLTAQMANQWLKSQGYLAEEFSPESESYSFVPSDTGKKLGIYSKIRDTQGRRFVQIYYSRPAQEFLIANFDKMLNYRKSDK